MALAGIAEALSSDGDELARPASYLIPLLSFDGRCVSLLPGVKKRACESPVACGWRPRGARAGAVAGCPASLPVRMGNDQDPPPGLGTRRYCIRSSVLRAIPLRARHSAQCTKTFRHARADGALAACLPQRRKTTPTDEKEERRLDANQERGF